MLAGRAGLFDGVAGSAMKLRAERLRRSARLHGSTGAAYEQARPASSGNWADGGFMNGWVTPRARPASPRRAKRGPAKQGRAHGMTAAAPHDSSPAGSSRRLPPLPSTPSSPRRRARREPGVAADRTDPPRSCTKPSLPAGRPCRRWLRRSWSCRRPSRRSPVASSGTTSAPLFNHADPRSTCARPRVVRRGASVRARRPGARRVRGSAQVERPSADSSRPSSEDARP